MRLLRWIYGVARKVEQKLKLIFIKAKYGSRIKFSFSQYGWERGTTFVVSSKKAEIVIGKNNNYRRYFQARAVGEGKLTLGDNVFCNTNVCIVAMNNISIADHVIIAPNVVIIDHDHDYMNGNDGYVSAPISIDEGVWIGANAVILKGVHIGKRAVVAAGSVVTKDVPAFSCVGGFQQKLSKHSSCLIINDGTAKLHRDIRMIINDRQSIRFAGHFERVPRSSRPGKVLTARQQGAAAW